MALNFKNVQGKAASSKVDLFTYKDGENQLRLVGNILPRYVYWVPVKAGKEIAIECLSFDRDKEKFTNVEKDHVLEYFPLGKDGKPNRPQWSYIAMCIDRTDGKVKPVPLKKTLLGDVINAAEDLGLDPTDMDNGFDLIFRRAKTGPLPYNVEYKLSQLKLKASSLSEEERAAVEKAKTIDEVYPRPTEAEIKALLEKITTQGTDEDETPSDAGVDQESVKDL